MNLDRPWPLKLELHYNGGERELGQYRFEIRVGKESFGGGSPEAALTKALVSLRGRARRDQAAAGAVAH